MELGSVSTNFANFNPRSPRGERRYNVNLWIIQEVKFQSTLSARRATVLLQPSHNLTSISIHALREESDSGLTFCAVETVNFNPRSPRGERRVTSVDDYAAIAISIHALREESDSLLQSLCQEQLQISIHALREESDLCKVLYFLYSYLNFNPRSPRGERGLKFVIRQLALHCCQCRSPRGERGLKLHLLQLWI